MSNFKEPVVKDGHQILSDHEIPSIENLPRFGELFATHFGFH